MRGFSGIFVGLCLFLECHRQGVGTVSYIYSCGASKCDATKCGVIRYSVRGCGAPRFSIPMFGTYQWVWCPECVAPLVCGAHGCGVPFRSQTRG